MKYPHFVGPSYVSQSSIADCERCVNFYVEQMQVPGAKNQFVLYPTPGLMPFAAGPDSPGRGIVAEAGYCFAALGTKFKEVMAGGTLTERGTMAIDGNPVTITTNGDIGQIFVTSGTKGYIYDRLTGVFTEVVQAVTMGGMVNARFVALDQDTSSLKISNLNDGTTWDPTQFAQRSSAPDPWRALLVVDGEIWLMGEATGDIWFDAGTFPFPFAPRQGLRIKPGIAAAFSLCELNGSVIWLSKSKDGQGQVVRARGYTAEPISTHALEFAISQYSRIDDAVGFTYQDQGHNLYVLGFPTANATWAFDDSTNLWHERGRYNGASGLYEAWGPQFHTLAFGHHLVQDFRSGTIFRMAIDLPNDTDGTPLRRLRIPPGLSLEHKRVFYDRLELYLERGLGLATGQGSNPMAMLRTSKNGGKTWGSERWRRAGRIGEFHKRRVIWNQLGAARDFVPAVAMSDPIPWRITDCLVEATPGTH